MSKLLSEIQNPFNNCAHKSNCIDRIKELELKLARTNQLLEPYRLNNKLQAERIASLERQLELCLLTHANYVDKINRDLKND